MIGAENLSYTYPGTTEPAVNDISFAVPAGEVFGFLGPSGAGKSTTQKVIIGLLKGYQGRITVLGRGLDQWGRDYYNHVGVGFELPNHYLKLTALENLKFFGSFFDRIIDPNLLLERVGLTPDANRRVHDFSKGMKVRLNFARSLLNDPQILFLDEPTSGLDPGNAKIIKDLILEQKELGKTIFLTTHNMYDADDLCDQVGFIVEGSLTLIGRPADLKIKHGRRILLLKYSNGLTNEVLEKEFELDGLGGNQDFLTLLRESTIISMHSEDATLNDVFIEVTGQSL